MSGWLSALFRPVLLLLAMLTAVGLVTLAIANRQGVRLSLDPFRPEDPAIAIDLPLYVYLFAMLILGVIVGGIAAWFAQSKWRRMARNRASDAQRWRLEAERLTRERDAQVSDVKRLGGSTLAPKSGAQSSQSLLAR